MRSPVKNRKPATFAHRASSDDVVRNTPTFARRPKEKLEDVDLDARTSGTGRRVAAATKADIRRSTVKTPRNAGRPEGDDVHLVLSTCHGVSSTENITMSRRCYHLCLAIAAKFANCAVDGTSISPIPGNRLREALERSVVRPRLDADCDSMDSLIKLLSKGQGLKVVRMINVRDSSLSIRG